MCAPLVVVDDHLDTANSLAMILQRSGHEVHIAQDGYAAIEITIRVRPDVVLLDIGLPGLDGFSVAKRLRAEPGLAKMRIIAVTGMGDEKDLQRAMEFGVDQLLIKPVDPAFLQSLLGRSPP